MLITLDPKEFRSCDHGYAVTSHSAQGLTSDRVLVDIDEGGPTGLVYFSDERMRRLDMVAAGLRRLAKASLA